MVCVRDLCSCALALFLLADGLCGNIITCGMRLNMDGRLDEVDMVCFFFRFDQR